MLLDNSGHGRGQAVRGVWVGVACCSKELRGDTEQLRVTMTSIGMPFVLFVALRWHWAGPEGRGT